MVRAFLALGTCAVSAPVSKWQMRQLMLLHFSFTRQYRYVFQVSQGCASAAPALSCSKAHQHFGSTCTRLHPCRCISSQRIHTTSTFELKSIASKLVEDRSTSAAERDDVASVAHLSHRDDRPLQSSILGRNLKVTCNVDTASCGSADRRIASRRELMSCG